MDTGPIRECNHASKEMLKENAIHTSRAEAFLTPKRLCDWYGTILFSGVAFNFSSFTIFAATQLRKTPDPKAVTPNCQYLWYVGRKVCESVTKRKEILVNIWRNLHDKGYIDWFRILNRNLHTLRSFRPCLSNHNFECIVASILQKDDSLIRPFVRKIWKCMRSLRDYSYFVPTPGNVFRSVCRN